MLFYIIYNKKPKKVNLFKKSSPDDDIENIVAFTTNKEYAEIYIKCKDLYIKEAYMDDTNYKNLIDLYSDRQIRVYRRSGTDEFVIVTEYDKIRIEQEEKLYDYIKQRATIYS